MRQAGTGRGFWVGAACGVLFASVMVAAATLAAVRGGVEVRVDGGAVAAAVAEQVRARARDELPALWRQLAAGLPDRAAAAVAERLPQVYVRIGPIRTALPDEARAAVVAWVRSALAEAMRQTPPVEAGPWVEAISARAEAELREALRASLHGRTFLARVGGLRMPIRILIE